MRVFEDPRGHVIPRASYFPHSDWIPEASTVCSQSHLMWRFLHE
jgi:hypothetical protein